MPDFFRHLSLTLVLCFVKMKPPVVAIATPRFTIPHFVAIDI